MADLGQIPPWLNVGPRDFGNAASEGARLDLARQQADTESAMNSVRLNIQKQQSDRDFAAQEQQHAFEREMKQTQIGMLAKQAADKHLAEQQYQSLVGSGMEPAQAMLRVGPSLGINMVGAGQLAHWGSAPPPPQAIDLAGNKGVIYNRHFYPQKKEGAEWADETIGGHLMQRNSTTGELKPILHSGNDDGVLTAQEKARIKFLQDQIKLIGSDPLAERNPAKQSQLQKYVNEVNTLTGGTADEEAPAATPSPAQTAAPVNMVWNPTKKRYMMPSQ